MTLDQINVTAADADFQAKVSAAVYKAAVAIIGEDPSGMSAGKAAKRHQLGTQVLQGRGNFMDSFVRTVASQIGEVASPSTIADLDIENSVSAVWDDIAGVTYDENQ